MSEEYSEDDALNTLELLREGGYNDARPSSMVIPELINVILLLDKRIKELNPGLI